MVIYSEFGTDSMLRCESLPWNAGAILQAKLSWHFISEGVRVRLFVFELTFANAW